MGEHGTVAGQGGEQIGSASLGAVEASGLSLAGLAPVMAMALGTAFAASEAGGAVPLSYLLGGVGAFALAYVFVKFVRRYEVTSGIAYTYIGRAAGIVPGFTAGWVYLLAWLSSTSVVLAISSVAISTLLARHDVNVSWWVFFLVEAAIILGLNYAGIRPSVRAQVALELGSMIVLAGVMVHVLVVGGASGLSLKPFEVSTSPRGWSGIGFGLIYGFSGYAGLPASVRYRNWAFSACGPVDACGWACSIPSLSPDRCQVPASGRPGQGARSARAAAPQAPLRRPPGSGS